MDDLDEDKAEKADPYFGVCPKCLDSDGYVNIGPGHWCVCDRCKTKWSFGSNVFSSWREETEADWRGTFERIREYEEVEAFYANNFYFESGERCSSCGKHFKPGQWAWSRIEDQKTSYFCNEGCVSKEIDSA